MDQEIKDLLEKNQATLEDLEKRVSKIQNKMMWNTIGSVLKVFLIVGPLIWGAFYFMPILRTYTDMMEPIRQLFDTAKQGPSAFENVGSPQVMNIEVSPENRAIFCDAKTREAIVSQICK